MQKEVLINFDRCLGCRSCQLACAVAHSTAGNLLGAVLNGEKPRTRIFRAPGGRAKGTSELPSL
ncbi:hypothetical protein [Desulfofundulus salinus]|uniref:hypothetical protein n=1 Tax=Desulfofundulus salinus TaxID=2419843 RepID=UPI001FA98FC2|nr:hypothetical protein [Desulfofundulus salinum]